MLGFRKLAGLSSLHSARIRKKSVPITAHPHAQLAVRNPELQRTPDRSIPISKADRQPFLGAANLQDIKVGSARVIGIVRQSLKKTRVLPRLLVSSFFRTVGD